jgi:hypothetical protein
MGTERIGKPGQKGGIIFRYESFDGKDNIIYQYCEAAPAASEFTAAWGSPDYHIVARRSPDNKTDERAITKCIVDASGSANCAARRCYNLNWHGANDWYLPANWELELMYNNLKSKGLGDFKKVIYWSSDQVGEEDPSLAWVLSFAKGKKATFRKNSVFRVRAVRMFTELKP